MEPRWMQCRATNPLARRIKGWSPKTCLGRPARKTRRTLDIHNGPITGTAQVSTDGFRYGKFQRKTRHLKLTIAKSTGLHPPSSKKTPWKPLNTWNPSLNLRKTTGKFKSAGTALLHSQSAHQMRVTSFSSLPPKSFVLNVKWTASTLNLRSSPPFFPPANSPIPRQAGSLWTSSTHTPAHRSRHLRVRSEGPSSVEKWPSKGGSVKRKWETPIIRRHHNGQQPRWCVPTIYVEGLDFPLGLAAPRFTVNLARFTKTRDCISCFGSTISGMRLFTKSWICIA